MRITFVLPGFNLTGGVRVVAIYADYLQKQGHQVLAVAPPEARPTWWMVFKSLVRGRGWPNVPYAYPSHFDQTAVEHRVFNHYGRLRASDIPDADVIVGTWWETVRWLMDMPASKGKPVHFMQGYEYWGGRPEDYDAVYRLPVPKIIIAEWMRGLLKDKFSRVPFSIVPNSVDATQFFAPERGKQPRPTVGMIYTAMHAKGDDIAIKAYELAKKEIPDLRMVAMGNRQPNDQLPLPAETDFTYQARDAALRAIYSSCDAWMLTSREEGFGLPILEAMACRTPVIATPVGAAPELVGKGGGLLVPGENPQAVAVAIAKISRMPTDEWKALSDKALATASGYTWDDAARLFEGALELVIAGKATA